MDVHERSDVVLYRIKFLKQKSQYEPKMAHYDADGCIIHFPELAGPNDKEIILYTVAHDESTFYANDRHKARWTHKDVEKVPMRKGEGESLMVSDFLVPILMFGRLNHNGWLVSFDLNGRHWLISPCREAHILFRTGAAHDGYFTNIDLANQVSIAFDIFENKYPGPGALGLFVFDNATTHQKRPEDGLLLAVWFLIQKQALRATLGIWTGYLELELVLVFENFPTMP
jgi:hypothetical protein